MSDPAALWEFIQEARDKIRTDSGEAHRLLVHVQAELLGEGESIRRWNLRQEWRLAQGVLEEPPA